VSDGAEPAKRSHLKMVDPRLLRYTHGTRRFRVVTIAPGAITAGLVLAQAWLIANTVADVVVHHDGLSRRRVLPESN
jgi:hypothetical protein